jgi:hypothetical protein
MAVEKSSIKPTAPRKPPAVEPTKGESGQPGVKYGDLRPLKIGNPAKSEMAHHFTAHDGSGGKAGKEMSNEGSASKAGKPGYP